MRDTGGRGRPVVYLNGAYADQSHWRRVIADLGSDCRHITYDERARGRSKRSADYSFEACLRDLDAVLEARDVDRPLLVGLAQPGDDRAGRVVGVQRAPQRTYVPGLYVSVYRIHLCHAEPDVRQILTTKMVQRDRHRHARPAVRRRQAVADAAT